MRKKYNVQTQVFVGDIGLKSTLGELQKLNFIIDLPASKTEEFDLVLNGRIKVEVMSASISEKDGAARFSFAYQESKGNVESENKIRLANGRFKKLHFMTCDFIVFVGVSPESNFFWVFPSSEIEESRQTLSLNPGARYSKYDKYRDAWHLLAANLNEI